ncbi:fumarylacetoacetate hydrolase family protein [Asticcacaulis excentricus]|uniref:Fumarylacetoacetate (FAA) hydrolase n=1 Tax=Asticcacaulis excentricus (strain ATCC 15261 / DSM 4724 / KCTC 12464 / NCIMB 9791 / VKM B-1370 / CB 48) TaxID=573065 RepID=E8RKP1_ASTEC|nr:fumarylacetoacetate hydrolase family protein [Asticcacaulis excentricus]ADU13575.1 fumarylacetoacetate (FAA) hydrolase [Asticcacaulis excentricus CB 48]
MTDSLPAAMLPVDWRDATLVGRILLPEGPTPVLVKGGEVFDMSAVAPTVAQLLANWPEKGVPAGGKSLGKLEDFAFQKAWEGKSTLLSPIDLQVVKAAGVTFAVSAVERVIEERARGDYNRAQAIRDDLAARVGGDIRSVVPGTEAAAKLKEALIADGLWSQYLEVAIGPDAEVFTKSPVLSSVGWGEEVGVRSDSTWNNPEPEVVMVVDPKGRALGATLGNDVNLRCFEGRSALLLGKAKDNNASCALGPFIRLFDEGFTIDDVRSAVLDLRIDGPEGYVLEGRSSMDQISRDPLELIRQALSEHHYPDGFVLMLGTLFAPTQDRDTPGRGFTHKVGDVVTVTSPKLGTLENRVTTSKDARAWTFGIVALMQNLVSRGLLKVETAKADAA